jgi:hypothetical protein
MWNITPSIAGFLNVTHFLGFRTEPNVSEGGSVLSEDGNNLVSETPMFCLAGHAHAHSGVT